MNYNEFDKYVFSRAAEDLPPVSESLHEKTEDTLSSLPLRFPRRKKSVFRTVAVAAACMTVLFLGVLPNVSVAYAAAAEDIPVISGLIRVLTIRNYFYEDGTHQLHADIPSLSDPDNSAAGDLINADITALTEAALEEFYAELESNGDGFHSLNIQHETVTNTPIWFTLRLMISQAEADSDLSYRYYHIDRLTGKRVIFGDLFREESRITLENLIVQQMLVHKENYWLDEEPGCTADQNFYFTADGSLVIVYDKYEVAPGFMGCPEFTLAPAEYEDLLSPNFASSLFLP